MHISEFHKLHPEIRREHINYHKYLVSEMAGMDIGYGSATISFYKSVLNDNSEILNSQLLHKLDSSLYGHCLDCGGLHDINKNKSMTSDNKLGFLMKGQLKGPANAFKITSGLCKDCLDTKLIKRD